MVHVLDTCHLGRSQVIAVTAIETAEGIALFDCGPDSTFHEIAARLSELGLSDVRHLFLSHIHLDHAGAAWRFAEAGARVYVHPRGAPHLLDPRKLVESATRIFGDKMGRLWGRVAPVSKEHLQVLKDEEIVQLGDLEVKAVATPGHASHHHVYQWEENLFGGDVAGVRIGGGPPIPPFVPPELHVEAWLQSIDRMRALGAGRLYLPHFGLTAGPVATHLDELEKRVRRWSEWFRQQLSAGKSKDELIPAFAVYESAELEKGGANKTELADYEAADPSYMAVIASERYWQKRGH